MDAAALVRQLQQTRPLAAQLARWSCLPVRVSPSFLRLARLRLLPQAGTGEEADLWLSDLVESRSGAGFAYRPGVRQVLRESLRQDEAALDQLWQTVHLAHAPWLSARARQEEELTWRLLRDASDAAIERIWADVVRELDEGPQPEGVARWVVRAVPDLPPGSLDHASGRRAFHGAHLLLGDASVLGAEAQRFLDTGEFAFATRRLPRRRIHLGLTPDSLIVSPLLPFKNSHEVELPATRPLWLQIEDYEPTGQQPPRVLALQDETVQSLRVWEGELPVGLGVRLIDGSRLWLAPQQDLPWLRERLERRSPRVQIEYDFELYGATKKVHLPFVVGVLADLTGSATEAPPPLQDRKFLLIDVDNFDSRVQQLRPRLGFEVPNVLEGEGQLRVELHFEGLADWAPASVVRQVAVLRQWQRAGDDLDAFAAAVRAGGIGAEGVLLLLADEGELQQLLALQLASGPPSAGATAHPLQSLQRERLAQRLRIDERTLQDTAYHGAAALALAARAFGAASLTQPDLLQGLEKVAQEMGRRFNRQIDFILHHPEFQRLEGAWRGLHHLVSQTETDELLKIRVLSASKAELLRSMHRSEDATWDQNPLFRKIHEDEYGLFGGEPYALLLGDYAFDHSAADVELLAGLARIASAAHAPFLAAAAPTLLQMESWSELGNPRDLARIPDTPEYARWRALRDSEDARYIGLTVPRVLARAPYRVQDRTPGDPAYEEGTSSHSPGAGRPTWTNAAYAMAINIARSFKQTGWFGRIRGFDSGGAVLGFPRQAAPADDGTVADDVPVEIALSARRAAALQELGLMPVQHDASRRASAFVGAASLQKAAEYDDADASANALLAAQWPYLLACCRFVHYLKCIARDRVGSYRAPQDLEIELNRWILNYVDGDPESSSAATKALRPLAGAEVVIEAVEGQPSSWQLKAFLRPHHQLEGLTVALRLLSVVPAAVAP